VDTWVSHSAQLGVTWVDQSAQSLPSFDLPAITTLAPPTPDPSTTQATTITGNLTVNNVDYDALIASPTHKAAFETKCQTTIAGAVGTSAANVDVTLSSGSVTVHYTITTPPSSSTAVLTQLEVAVSTGTLATAVVSSVSLIDGIDSFVSGSMSVSAATPALSEDKGATTTAFLAPLTDDDDDGVPMMEVIGVVCAAGLVGLCVLAVVWLLFCRSTGGALPQGSNFHGVVSQAIAVGDKVRVRNAEGEQWQIGVVASFSPMKVRLDGCRESSEYKFAEKVKDSE
jgi:hypothetical protein